MRMNLAYEESVVMKASSAYLRSEIRDPDGAVFVAECFLWGDEDGQEYFRDAYRPDILANARAQNWQRLGLRLHVSRALSHDHILSPGSADAPPGE